jgi:hypothetical protein
MHGWIGPIVFAVMLAVLLSSVASADPICVDPANCGGPSGCMSDADCTVPGERCIVGFDPTPPFPPVNTCCAACPSSSTPYATCFSTFSDCDGCSFGCVDPVNPITPVPALSELGRLLLATLLVLALAWTRRRHHPARAA